MRLEKLNFTQLYYLGPPTPPLKVFWLSLLAIHRDSAKEAWRRLRTEDDTDRMLAEREINGGPDAQGQYILSQLGGHQHGFLPNPYPYIMPEGLLHFCYWSTIGPLPRLLIDAAVVSEFPGQSAVIFENHGKAKSIPYFHVHTVVDTRSLMYTVYSRQPAIAKTS